MHQMSVDIRPSRLPLLPNFKKSKDMSANHRSHEKRSYYSVRSYAGPTWVKMTAAQSEFRLLDSYKFNEED
jgi:hypothetical protein